MSPSTVNESNQATVATENINNKSYVDELTEKHITLSSLAVMNSSSADTELERECYLLLSMGSKVTVTQGEYTYWRLCGSEWRTYTRFEVNSCLYQYTYVQRL